MTASNPRKLAVLCDFDGTITVGQVLDILYNNFADPCCNELIQRWVRGEISTVEEIEGCFATMKANQAEMEAALDREAQLDPAFPDLVQFCRQRGYPLAIVSDGLQWYIEYVLNKFGFAGLPVYANQIEFLPDGFRITMPWYDPETPKRGVSKPAILRRYKKEGYAIVFIGDGLSDIEAVPFADIVFAHQTLWEYCQENGFPAIKIRGLADALADRTVIARLADPVRDQP